MEFSLNNLKTHCPSPCAYEIHGIIFMVIQRTLNICVRRCTNRRSAMQHICGETIMGREDGD